jgi:hypothetical protein
MALERRGGRVIAALSMIAVFVVGAALVGGCGAPQFTYVKNSADKTYFRVPSSWTKIDQGPIDDLFSPVQPGSAAAVLHKQRLWSVAYDADEEPTALHMTSYVSNDVPVVYATVEHLIAVERDAVSFDTMRDFFFPVTGHLRQVAEQNGYELQNFELLRDQVLTPSAGIRGIRVIFNYQFPTGVIHTFDQTVYANNDTSTLYLMLIRCTSRCYQAHRAEIDAVATSFTVRSTP